MNARLAGLVAGLTLVACTPRETPPAASEPSAAERSLSGLQAQAVAARSASRELPEVVVPQRTGFIIDGVLDEPGWADAAATGPFGSAGDGARVDASQVHASALLAADAQHLYVAIWVADEAAESPNARDARDPHIWATASGVELMLQPGDPGDNTHYYEVQVDVAEAVWDTQFDDYNRPITGEGDARQFGHQTWDAALERRVARHDGGYVVEAALPWASIRSDRVAVPPAPGDVWRANLYSFRDGQRHALAWSRLHGEGNFHRSARFGRLTFGATP